MSETKLSPSKTPRHVAIIMDGNRRWADQRNLPHIEGHRKGADQIKPVVQKAIDLGVKSLTFWAFSTENWKRNQQFLTDIMKVFREFLSRRQLFDELKERGGKIHIFGDLSKFPQDIQEKINQYLKDKSPTKKVIDVNFALNYGGREEILTAIRALMKDELRPEQVTEDVFGSYLYTKGQPDVDFIIRTGGEIRLSGYLPWQSVYAELYFIQTYWPDFTPEDLEQAINEYGQRDRRMGGDSVKGFTRRDPASWRGLSLRKS